MQNQINPTKWLLSITIAVALPGCATYIGIGSDHRIMAATTGADLHSLPPEHGRWPAADWAAQFGDRQLTALIAEALHNSPTLDQARARVATAAAYMDSAHAVSDPKVNLDASMLRQQYTANALIPPPVAGSYQTENKAVASASYELDLWGKNSQGELATDSTLRAAKAEQEKIRLTLSTAIARTYNELARLYALRDLDVDDIAQRRQMRDLSTSRLSSGLDTEVEQQSIQRLLAGSLATLTALDGQILDLRYQLAALLGAGPDRGLQITRPTLNTGDSVALPDNLPADLVSRRPDIVMALWRVDAARHEVKAAKADFYPDINLVAAVGLDAFGFGRFLNASSRTLSTGPAIHLPIFDGGALRAQLKGRYAEFDYAVASYNQTLVSAMSEVATQVARVHATDAQIADVSAANDAAQRSWKLAMSQYKAGLSTRLSVLQARLTAISTEQALTNLRMNRRDQQIGLAAALGGGFADAFDAQNLPAGKGVPVEFGLRQSSK